jgi:hypothetical protein
VMEVRILPARQSGGGVTANTRKITYSFLLRTFSDISTMVVHGSDTAVTLVRFHHVRPAFWWFSI